MYSVYLSKGLFSLATESQSESWALTTLGKSSWCCKRSHKLYKIGVGRIRMSADFAYNSVAYDPTKTGLSESQAENKPITISGPLNTSILLQQSCFNWILSNNHKQNWKLYLQRQLWLHHYWKSASRLQTSPYKIVCLVNNYKGTNVVKLKKE